MAERAVLYGSVDGMSPITQVRPVRALYIVNQMRTHLWRLDTAADEKKGGEMPGNI